MDKQFKLLSIISVDVENLFDDGRTTRANEADRQVGVIKPKKKFFVFLPYVLLLLFAQFILLPSAFGAGTDCPDGIAGYWRLGDAAAGPFEDIISANNGTCTDPGCPVDITGTIGGAKRFNGSSTITVNGASGFNWAAGQSFTIELWMQRDSGVALGDPEVFIGRADSGLNWYLGINASGNAQALLNASDGSGPTEMTVSKDLTSSDGTWHHVALVHNAGTNILYVDGVPSTPQTANYTAGFISNTAPVTMGSLDGSDFFNGALDEVAVYTRALTANEIKSHYYISREYCSRYDSDVKIMPMGNSITTGVWEIDIVSDVTLPLADMRIGYRFDLWELLGNNLYMFNFIGSQDHGWNHDPDLNPPFDDDNAGFGGIRDDQLRDLLRDGVNPQNGEDLSGGGSYLDAFPTEIILLHIGTNGLNASATDVSNILDEVDAFSKNVTVLLARIIDRAPNNATVTAFNDAIEAMAADRIDQGDKIIMVDMQNGAGLNYTVSTSQTVPNPNGDIYDGIHPNPSGYNKIAGQWFSALETILPQSELPDITSTAITTASKDVLYTYTVTATGPPQPTFELANNPAPGQMSIDSTTGTIQWTPDAVGDYDVTVRASNWTGTDTQSFTITVADTPNADPVITSTAPTDAAVGTLYTYPAVATDANDAVNTLVWSLTGEPAGMVVDPATGAVTWTPAAGSEGDYAFTLTVTDPNGGVASQNIAITVTTTPITPATGGGGGGGGGCFIMSLY